MFIDPAGEATAAPVAGAAGFEPASLVGGGGVVRDVSTQFGSLEAMGAPSQMRLSDGEPHGASGLCNSLPIDALGLPTRSAAPRAFPSLIALEDRVAPSVPNHNYILVAGVCSRPCTAPRSKVARACVASLGGADLPVVASSQE